MRELTAGTPVMFQEQKYRVVRVLPSGRDIVIQDIEGNRLTVSPMTVEVGWE